MRLPSWMMLKSSEIKNFLSWRVSAILKSFLVSSAFCHCTLPLLIRPILWVLKFVPKKINLLTSRIQSLHLLLVVNDHDESQSFWHWESDIRISSWLNVSPTSFTDRHSSCGWASRGRSSWLCFSLWSACKSKYIRFQRGLRGLLLVVVVLFVDQVRDQLIQSMRNSDPRVRIVFVYRFSSNFHSIFTLQVAGCDFSHGPNFGVPSNPTFRVSWFFISWQSVLTTCHWFCELWELFSVLCHEVLSDFNCFSGIVHQYKILSIGLVVGAFPLVPCTFAIKFLVRELQSKV